MNLRLICISEVIENTVVFSVHQKCVPFCACEVLHREHFYKNSTILSFLKFNHNVFKIPYKPKKLWACSLAWIPQMYCDGIEDKVNRTAGFGPANPGSKASHINYNLQKVRAGSHITITG